MFFFFIDSKNDPFAAPMRTTFRASSLQLTFSIQIEIKIMGKNATHLKHMWCFLTSIFYTFSLNAFLFSSRSSRTLISILLCVSVSRKYAVILCFDIMSCLEKLKTTRIFMMDIVFVVVNLFPVLWLYGLAANDNVLCNSADLVVRKKILNGFKKKKSKSKRNIDKTHVDLIDELRSKTEQTKLLHLLGSRPYSMDGRKKNHLLPPSSLSPVLLPRWWGLFAAAAGWNEPRGAVGMAN
ncbi:hypothetical protein AGLY_014413, partial [Aphis glycines]